MNIFLISRVHQRGPRASYTHTATNNQSLPVYQLTRSTQSFALDNHTKKPAHSTTGCPVSNLTKNIIAFYNDIPRGQNFLRNPFFTDPLKAKYASYLNFPPKKFGISCQNANLVFLEFPAFFEQLLVFEFPASTQFKYQRPLVNKLRNFADGLFLKIHQHSVTFCKVGVSLDTRLKDGNC